MTKNFMGWSPKAIGDEFRKGIYTENEISGVFGRLSSPLLHIDFKSKIDMKSGNTGLFSRNSAATYTDRYGTLKEASEETPRFARDGLILEGSAVNLLSFSDNLSDASWENPNGNYTVNSHTAISPNGESLASNITIDVAGDVTFSKAVSGVAGNTYGISFWARVASGDTTSGEVTLQGNASSTFSVSDAWERKTISVNTTSDFSRIDFSFNDLVDVEVFGFQLEEGSATSYMPNGPREADSYTIDTYDNFSGWGSEFTLHFEVTGDFLLEDSDGNYVSTRSGDVTCSISGKLLSAHDKVKSLTVTSSGSVVSLYVNGRLKDNSEINGVTSNGTFSITGNSGNLKSLRSYDFQLTPQEVMILKEK